MAEPILRAVYGSPDHPLRIGNIEMPCYVLEDGRRVLVQGEMITALDMKQGTAGRGSGDRLAKFIRTKAVQPFVPDSIARLITEPIRFRVPNGSLAYGYEATILADLCDVVLAARKEGKLNYQQVHIADRCELLVRGFARVGIIALVDEATGYQQVRDRDELQRILAAYISPELLPWTRRFPEEFYEHLFRLWGWQYRPLSVKRPRMVGKLTAQLIYEKLPQGVLDELRRKNPVDEAGHRRYRHHQFLTEDVGNPHLEKQLAVVTTLMRISPNRRAFERHFARAFPPPAIQTQLFPDDLGDDTDD